MAAMPIGAPGCPDLDFVVTSTANVLMLEKMVSYELSTYESAPYVLIAFLSISVNDILAISVCLKRSVVGRQ